MRRPLRLAALTALLLLGAALAGAPARAHAQRLVDDRGQALQFAAPAQRVVSLLPSLTEIVCALEACARLVGTDSYSNWPGAVKQLPKLGGIEDTQIERIVALKPDLVLVARSARAIDRLESLGLRVMALEPKNLGDTRRVIEVLALALGDAPAGARLWQRIEQRLDAAAARVPSSLRGQTVYLEVAAAPYAASVGSYLGEVLLRLGLGNVVPAALGPFPQLSPEFVLRAQPQIVMAQARTLSEMAARPGWDRLRALRERRSCGFAPDQWDTLARPGPRLADAAEAIADCLAGLPGAGRGAR